MIEISRNMVLKVISSDVLPSELVRVLWIDENREYVVVIPINQITRKKQVRIQYVELLNEIVNHKAVPTKVTIDPRALMSDEEIERNYPAIHRTKQSNKSAKTLLREEKRAQLLRTKCSGAIQATNLATQKSYAVEYRNYWYEIIRPILSEEENIFRGEISLNRLIAPRAEELFIGRTEVYEALYRYWAGGSVKSALLPDMDKCGGKGKARAGKSKVVRPEFSRQLIAS